MSQGRIHGLKSEGDESWRVRNEAPKAPRGWGVRKGVPSPLGRVWGGGYAPSPIFFDF